MVQHMQPTVDLKNIHLTLDDPLQWQEEGKFQQSHINSPFGIDSVKLTATEKYLAMEMCMSKHAYHQPIYKNTG